MGMQSCQVLALCGMVTLPLAQLFPLTGHVPSPLALFPQAQEAVRACRACTTCQNNIAASLLNNAVAWP